MTKLVAAKTNRAMFALLAASAFLASACTNGRLASSSALSLASPTPTVSASPTAGDVYTIASVTASSPSGSSSTGELQLFIDANSTAAASEAISAHCIPGSSDCTCQFKWVELNPNSQSTVQIPRSVTTTVDLTQTNLVQCPEPSVWSTDIPDGTTVSITIAPSIVGSQNFSTNTYSYIMGQSSTTSGGGYSFTNSTGLGFENVYHYSCFDNTTRGIGINSQVVQVSNGSSDTAALKSAYAPLASSVCAGASDETTSSSSGTGSTDCSNTSVNVGYTAQAAYYNLYNIDGDYNVANERFYCPQVVESLTRNGSVGAQNQLWPLDTTFALAQSSNPSFPVGVEAFTKLANPGDTASNTSTCFASSNTNGTASTSSSSGGTDTASASGSLAQACLGFAALPNTDGSCPTLKDSAGNVRAMYRLRRYTILYPQRFEASGTPMAGGTAADTIYVLDRPVSAVGVDPIVKPDTMLGPKPCPYAYYDRTGETDTLNPGTPQYSGTNDTRWTGKDVDGNQFPNTDSGVSGALSCSSVIAIPDASTQQLSLGTVNKLNAVLSSIYVRPITAWTPHYEEDTSFQACAPQSWPVVRDPPLHFARMPSGNIAYCAEDYPTQNPNVIALDPKITGNVAPFTSHTSKNAFDSTNLALPACVASTTPLTIPGGYAAGAQLARHPAISSAIENNLGLDTLQTNTTCDRTVVASQATLSTTFPLLAPPQMVESALAADPGYMCSISFDNNTGSNSKLGKASPTQGCCGSAVRVYTSPAQTGFNNNSAHLEPNTSVTAPTNCLEPTY